MKKIKLVMVVDGNAHVVEAKSKTEIKRQGLTPREYERALIIIANEVMERIKAKALETNTILMAYVYDEYTNQLKYDTNNAKELNELNK